VLRRTETRYQFGQRNDAISGVTDERQVGAQRDMIVGRVVPGHVVRMVGEDQ